MVYFMMNIKTATEMMLRQLVKLTDAYPLTEADIALITTASSLHDSGKIRIPEAKEVGVTAFVEKPIFMSELRKVLTKPMDIKEETTQQTERENRYSGKKVLLVEDNELNREIATALLEEIGITVDSVEDGTDAVERMNEVDDERYDLIFMDIQMPKMDGYMTTREIRTLKNNKKANIPIIAMTANAFEEDKKKAFKAGMNAHIAKPIDIKTILAVFDQVFGTS